MELSVSYQNRRRSPKIDNYLEHTFDKLKPVAHQVNQAVVEIVKEPDGDNLIQLSIIAPKAFETVVSAKHENIYAAVNLAIGKLRRNLLKIKDRYVRSRKKNQKSALLDSIYHEPDISIDAAEIIKFEKIKESNFPDLVKLRE